MTEGTIRYDLLVQEALRSVVRAVVELAARPPGLPGEHHVFLTFSTRYPGVSMPPALSGQYPDEMTIVLKQNFWELVPTDESVTVGLYFNQEPQRLVIPWLALSRFTDPVAQVAFQLSVPLRAEEQAATSPHASEEATGPRPAPGEELPAAASVEGTAPGLPNEVPTEVPEESKVVSLDAFRKK